MQIAKFIPTWSLLSREMSEKWKWPEDHWFNPPYSQFVKINITVLLLKLVYEHFHKFLTSWLYFCKGWRDHPMSFLGIITDFTWWWCYRPGTLVSVLYLFIAIIPRFTQTPFTSTCKGPINESNRIIQSFSKDCYLLLVSIQRLMFNSNRWKPPKCVQKRLFINKIR